MLQTPSSDESYRSGQFAPGSDRAASALRLADYIDILKERFFSFLVPFGLISVLGLYFAAIQGPSFLSEGKILVEAQAIAPEIVRPIIAATANERVQLIRQRITTRDNLVSIANKFGLFRGQIKVPELMLASFKFNSVDVDAQARQSAAIALTVGFEYGSPGLAMRVASEFINQIIDEDARLRTSRATETVKLLTDETRDIENKLESTQMKILDFARQTNATVPATPEQQNSELASLAALRAELIQKQSLYSDAHPSLIALKKRIAAMESSLRNKPAVQARSAVPEDIETLKRQRDALESRLADANIKLASARLGEKLENEQQSVRMQVLEAPQQPQKPEKSGRLKIVAVAFFAATLLGLGIAIGPQLLKGAIRSRHQLSGLVPGSLIIAVPYIATSADLVRTRLRTITSVLSLLLLVTLWGGLTAAIVLHLDLPVSSSFHQLSFAPREINR